MHLPHNYIINNCYVYVHIIQMDVWTSIFSGVFLFCAFIFSKPNITLYRYVATWIMCNRFCVLCAFLFSKLIFGPNIIADWGLLVCTVKEGYLFVLRIYHSTYVHFIQIFMICRRWLALSYQFISFKCSICAFGETQMTFYFIFYWKI